MDNGYSLSDLRAATGDGNGFGGNGAWWIVILFLFCFMGGGFWGNRQGEFGQYATAASQQEILFGQHDVQRLLQGGTQEQRGQTGVLRRPCGGVFGGQGRAR